MKATDLGLRMYLGRFFIDSEEYLYTIFFAHDVMTSEIDLAQLVAKRTLLFSYIRHVEVRLGWAF